MVIRPRSLAKWYQVFGVKLKFWSTINNAILKRDNVVNLYQPFSLHLARCTLILILFEAGVLHLGPLRTTWKAKRVDRLSCCTGWVESAHILLHSSSPLGSLSFKASKLGLFAIIANKQSYCNKLLLS